MFEKFIYKLIQKLKHVYEFLDEVYKEAYSKVEKEFNERVNKIKEKNKKMFIKRLAALTIMKCFQDTGEHMPIFMAEEFAKKMFEEAKRQGDIDELNKLKGD